MTSDHTMMLLENVAGISAELHRHSRYMDLYKARAETLSGFPGIWALAAEVGEAFTDAAASGQTIAGEDYDWIDAIGEMSGRIVELYLELESAENINWRAEASAVIRNNRCI